MIAQYRVHHSIGWTSGVDSAIRKTSRFLPAGHAVVRC